MKRAIKITAGVLAACALVMMGVSLGVGRPAFAAINAFIFAVNVGLFFFADTLEN